MNTKFHDLIILNRPDRIQVPIDDSKDYTIIPKIGEYVYKTSPIAHTKGEIKEEVYSPLSGKYIETSTIGNYKYLEIENDYKEMNENLRGTNKFLDHIPYEEFMNKLKTSGISDNNISIYTKYENSSKKSLIIDCFDNCILYEKFIIENYLEELLEMIDAIYEINKLNNCIFVLNKKDKKLKKLLEQRIGTYLNFKIIPISERKKANKINIIAKKLKINEQDIIQEKIKIILAMENLFKYNVPFIEKHVIVINGKNNIPVKVKIGTKVSYVLNSLDINANKYILKTCDEDINIENQDIIIDSNINEIIV